MSDNIIVPVEAAASTQQIAVTVAGGTEQVAVQVAAPEIRITELYNNGLR